MPKHAKLEKNKPVLIENFAVQRADGAELALHFHEMVAIDGSMPVGGKNRVEIAIASIPALLAMKGYAIEGRHKQKDAYDIYYCVRNYPGGPSALAADCKPILQLPSGKQGYDHIAGKFAKDDGYGPTCVRKFVEESDRLEGRSPAQWQTDAFGQVQAWLKELGLVRAISADRYNAAEAEAKWQKIWDERGIFATRNEDVRNKYYVLEMFPYPSGRIHMGHVRNYTMGDVVARVKRAMGFDVLHPMGWDAFGMPAENAAMERKVHPKTWTYQNIDAMKKQLKSMGLSLDWSREIATCDPAYYKHQQKMFLDFLRAGLVERKQSKVNWDPVDNTVLANEQVIDGRGWRSGALVEQRELTQWFFAITKFAAPLLDALDTLDRWPEKVRLMQKNWIGRSEGLLVRFALDQTTTPNGESELEVFTTRPDTLFGAKFMALAPDHPLAAAAAAKNPALAKFIAECRHRGTAQAEIDTAEKLGFDTGMKAVHPFDASWQIPVYVANFILMDYGTGAIFGCPAHDQRDLDFVNKYGLGNVPVVCPPDVDPKTFVITDTAYDGDCHNRLTTATAA